MFPVKYELNSYILFRRNFVFKGLNKVVIVSVYWETERNNVHFRPTEKPANRLRFSRINFLVPLLWNVLPWISPHSSILDYTSSGAANPTNCEDGSGFNRKNQFLMQADDNGDFSVQQILEKWIEAGIFITKASHLLDCNHREEYLNKKRYCKKGLEKHLHANERKYRTTLWGWLSRK
jgi:hypothetical protein